MIRIAHILDTPGPGGAENVLLSLAGGLDPEKFQSSVCILQNSWMHRQLVSNNGQTSLFFLKDAGAVDLLFLRELASFLRRQRIDIVHSHEFFMNVYGTLAARLAGIPSVATAHGQVEYVSAKMRRRLAYRWVAKRGSMVAVSNQLADRIAKEIGVPKARIQTIYNGITVEQFQKRDGLDGLRKELGIANGGPAIGMVGNLYPVKGYEYFIRAMAIVKKSFPNAVFLICGRGELQGELESLSAECGLGQNVKFLGFRDDVPALLQLMDVFVLSSLSEGLSLSILEAMAAAKPTVVTDVGGNREIVVDGETGFLVPPRDAEKLAEKVCLLLRDKALAERLGRSGRERVESHFSQERMLRDYEQLYLSLLDNRRRHRPNPELNQLHEQGTISRRCTQMSADS